MKAYLFAFVRVEDFEPYQREYLMEAHPLLTRYNGKITVVSEKIHQLEGELPEGKVVIVEFPSKERALEFYNSVEYQKLKIVREKYTSSDSMIIENEFDPNKM